MADGRRREGGGFVGSSTINIRLEKWKQLKESERAAIVKNVIIVITKFRKITSWLRASRERRGGSGTFSGRNASLGDFGMIRVWASPLVAARPN